MNDEGVVFDYQIGVVVDYGYFVVYFDSVVLYGVVGVGQDYVMIVGFDLQVVQGVVGFGEVILGEFLIFI